MSAGGLVMTRRVGGLVALEPEGARVAEWVARRCGVEGLAASPTGEGFSVDAEAHAEADELALAGDPAGAVQVLGDAGAPRGAAQGWITALCRRRAAAAVTVAHGGTPLGELRWLVGPDGTAWRVRDEAAAASRGSGWEDEEPRRRSVLTPVPGDTLRAALAELFTDHEVRVP